MRCRIAEEEEDLCRTKNAVPREQDEEEESLLKADVVNEKGRLIRITRVY